MIREYKKGDEIAIAAIEEECFSLPWSSQGIIDALWEGARFLVFEEAGEDEEGKIIGCLIKKGELVHEDKLNAAGLS